MADAGKQACSPMIEIDRELSPRLCAWPLGDPQDPAFRFCRAPTPLGQPYCAEHDAMAWRSGEEAPGGGDGIAGEEAA